MKIVVLDGYLVGFGGIDWTPVSQSGEFLYYDMTTQEDDIAARIQNADVVCTNRCPITAETIARNPNLKLVHSFGTGYNQIDVKAAADAGILVTNTPGYGRGAVAQMAIALLFAAARKVSQFDHYIKTVGWEESIDPNICAIPQMELTGKTLGIIGLGDIGYAVAKIAMAMDMHVLAYQRHPDPAKECEQLKFCDLEYLLAHSDIISLHCPLTEQTRAMINEERLDLMKNGAILINTSRGGVVDEDAVRRALDIGKLAAYAADVFCADPCGKDNPLACHPKCIATPHVAWMPTETRQRVVEIAAGNIAGFLSGKPVNIVNG